jgi:OFA family oxalate/formate antiporter-like MFS transporter
MMVISIYQYSWFLFAYALEKELSWDLSVIGLTFTVFAYTVTFIQPLSGFIADSYGPQKVSIIASLLVGAGLIFSSLAFSPGSLYFYYGMGGLGVGVLYGVSTACAVKWFPEKRGFVTGLVVFGFGAGTAIFNWFIEELLESKGLHATFCFLGIAMIAILIPLSLLYKYPEERQSQESLQQERHAMVVNHKPFDMLKTYQWFLIYFSFIATVSVVLMFGAQMKMLAREFNIPNSYFSIVLIVFPLGNGLSRVVAGAISDRLGRERTMMLFYSILGLSIFAFVLFAQVALLFVILVFIAAILGGAPFALYPATIGDYYGPKYSTTNYGITYTAKSWAGLISGWLSGYLVMQFGSYRTPLVIVAILSLIAAICSNPKFLYKPQETAGKQS